MKITTFLDLWEPLIFELEMLHIEIHSFGHHLNVVAEDKRTNRLQHTMELVDEMVGATRWEDVSNNLS
jgi:hypothetical protein